MCAFKISNNDNPVCLLGFSKLTVCFAFAPNAETISPFVLYVVSFALVCCLIVFALSKVKTLSCFDAICPAVKPACEWPVTVALSMLYFCFASLNLS